MDDDKLHCRDCQYYRPQWGECCFGGGWGHYPEPDDECVRMFNDDENENENNDEPISSAAVGQGVPADNTQIAL